MQIVFAGIKGMIVEEEDNEVRNEDENEEQKQDNRKDAVEWTWTVCHTSCQPCVTSKKAVIICHTSSQLCLTSWWRPSSVRWFVTQVDNVVWPYGTLLASPQGGERCVTSQITATKKTNLWAPCCTFPWKQLELNPGLLTSELKPFCQFILYLFCRIDVNIYFSHQNKLLFSRLALIEICFPASS